MMVDIGTTSSPPLTRSSSPKLAMWTSSSLAVAVVAESTQTLRSLVVAVVLAVF